jgi:hypothetical protein
VPVLYRFALVVAVVAAALAGAVFTARDARASSGQDCHFAFIRAVTPAAGRHGWDVRFGAQISCTETTNDLELGGNLVSWGPVKGCSNCGRGWYVTSALTRPVYERTTGRRSLTVTGTYFERRRNWHKLWAIFVVQPLGATLHGFHDTNTRKCGLLPGDDYSCDGFSTASGRRPGRAQRPAISSIQTVAARISASFSPGAISIP